MHSVMPGKNKMRKEKGMRSKLKFTVFLLLAIAASAFFIGAASASDDWGTVIQTIFKHKVNDRLTFVLFPEVRFNDDSKNFYYQQYRGGFEYAAYEFLDLGVTYEYVTVKNNSGKWSDENRLVFLAGPHWKFAGFDFWDKNRMEVRYLGQEQDHFRYRNEFIIERSVDLLGFKMKPFASVEPWYDLKYDIINFIRYQIGFSKSINKNLSYALFYRVDDVNKTKGKWQATGYIGIKTVVKY